MPRKTPTPLHSRSELVDASMRPRPDAAENPRYCCDRFMLLLRFNEAAARCRGKHALEGGGVMSVTHASMRPRPDAAENEPRPKSPTLQRVASMRPRPDAAENPKRKEKATTTATLQ